jgi:hypothetical protein
LSGASGDKMSTTPGTADGSPALLERAE